MGVYFMVFALIKIIIAVYSPHLFYHEASKKISKKNQKNAAAFMA